MKNFLISLALLVSPDLFAQLSDNFHEQLDSLLLAKIQSYRVENGMYDFKVCPVLEASSTHHSYYMSQSFIVSHEERMDLPQFLNLNSPRERINYYFADEIPLHNTYAEICLGIKIKNNDVEATADKIFREILNSENKILLDSKESRFLGLSVQHRKNRYFATINLGMDKNTTLMANNENL